MHRIIYVILCSFFFHKFKTNYFDFFGDEFTSNPKCEHVLQDLGDAARVAD